MQQMKSRLIHSLSSSRLYTQSVRNGSQHEDLFKCCGLPVIGTVSCGPVSNPNATKTFHLNTIFKAQWYRAQHHCLTNGMRLANVFSKEVNDQIVKQIRESGYISDFWLGGTSLGNGLDLYWHGQNEPIRFNDWTVGEPNFPNNVELCLSMLARKGLKWSVEKCSNEYYFVCEKEVEQ